MLSDLVKNEGALTKALLGILSVAFMAWAGVVYYASQDAIKQTAQLTGDMVTVMSGIQANQAALVTEVRLLTKGLDIHLNADWHSKAGEQLSRIDQQLAATEREIRELKRRLANSNLDNSNN